MADENTGTRSRIASPGCRINKSTWNQPPTKLPCLWPPSSYRATLLEAKRRPLATHITSINVAHPTNQLTKYVSVRVRRPTYQADRDRPAKCLLAGLDRGGPSTPSYPPRTPSQPHAIHGWWFVWEDEKDHRLVLMTSIVTH